MKPDDPWADGSSFPVVDGTPVWYYPSMNGPERFAGFINGSDIFTVGGTPCVRLRDLEPAYGEWKAGGRATTHRTSVPAAAVHCVKSRQP